MLITSKHLSGNSTDSVRFGTAGSGYIVLDSCIAKASTRVKRRSMICWIV